MEGGSGSGGGGCCIARYTPGVNNNTPTNYYGYNNNNCYNYNYDMSKMDRIMLRFRPIAPKPVPGGTAEAGSRNDVVKAAAGTSKPKRRNAGASSRRKKSRSPADEGRSDGDKRCHVVTLPLLPETPDLSPREDPSRPGRGGPHPVWLSFDRTAAAPEAAVGSSVVVEGVTDTWPDGTGLGRTDEERERRLMGDACPGFVSDGWNRVLWANDAYRRMVSSSTAAVAVRLRMRENVELPRGKLFGAFTCRVRVVYGKDGSHSITLPCDVWRMDAGGFAWRLDLNAALSLGR